MSIPKIDPYPPAPTPEDDEATFDEKAYEHAASLEPRRVQMNEVATYVNTRAADANSRAVAAAASATASANSATRSDEWANKAPGSVVASGKYSARHYSDLSDKFANAPEDEEVLPGHYSAFHWKEKAKKIADVHATTVATDPLPTVLATNVQEALRDLAYQSDQLRIAKNQLKYGDGPYPVLDFQFQGAKYLDPRVQFSRASLDWDWEGNEYGIDEPVLTDKGLWGSPVRTNLYPYANAPQDWRVIRATFNNQYELGSGVIGEFSLTEDNGYVDFRMDITQPDEFSCQITLGKTDGDVIVSIYSGASGALLTATIDTQGALIGTGGSQSATARVSVSELLGHRLVKLEGVLSSEGINVTRIRVTRLDVGDFSAGRAQIERGPFCTPFIPTNGSQVTVSRTDIQLPIPHDTFVFSTMTSYEILHPVPQARFITLVGESEIVGLTSKSSLNVGGYYSIRTTPIIELPNASINPSLIKDVRAALSFDGVTYRACTNGTNHERAWQPVGVLLSAHLCGSPTGTAKMTGFISSFSFYNQALTIEQLQDLTS